MEVVELFARSRTPHNATFDIYGDELQPNF